MCSSSTALTKHVFPSLPHLSLQPDLCSLIVPKAVFTLGHVPFSDSLHLRSSLGASSSMECPQEPYPCFEPP